MTRPDDKNRDRAVAHAKPPAGDGLAAGDARACLARLSPEVRRLARAGMTRDDGWVREFVLHNFHVVSPQLVRSGQPSPRHLCRWLSRHRIRTVINLRGDEPGNPMVEAERRLLAELGVRYETVRMFSREMEPRETLERLYALFGEVETPVWLHCKSGADRAGLASALFLHWREGRPLAEARHQLRLWPYWHYRWSKTGLLDAFLAAYLRDHPDGDKPLIDWIRDAYDRQREQAAFKRPKLLASLADGFVDRVLRRE